MPQLNLTYISIHQSTLPRLQHLSQRDNDVSTRQYSPRARDHHNRLRVINHDRRPIYSVSDCQLFKFKDGRVVYSANLVKIYRVAGRRTFGRDRPDAQLVKLIEDGLTRLISSLPDTANLDVVHHYTRLI